MRTKRGFIQRYKWWTLEETWQLYTLSQTDKTYSEIAKELGRTRIAIQNRISMINFILKFNTIDEAKAHLIKVYYKNPTYTQLDLVLEIWRRVKLQNNKVEPQVEPIVAPVTNGSPKREITRLEDAIDMLDRSFEKTKEDMAVVISLALEREIENYKKENDAQIAELKTEIAALKTVVNAAKSQNLATSLKKALMGHP